MSGDHCHTSGLLAYFNSAEPSHAAVGRALEVEAGPVVGSPFVIAELDYLVATRVGVAAELSTLEQLCSGAYELASFDAADLASARAVIERYRDQDIGVTDASLVVLAHRYGTRSILTLDRRQFEEVLQPLSGYRFDVAVDLFEIPGLAELAETLAVGLVANRGPVRRALQGLRRGGRGLAAVAETTMSATVESELGEEVAITWKPRLAERDPDRYLAWALKALQRIAQADDRHLVLFIDEFQELASDRRPYGHPDALTKMMRSVLQRSARVTCLFAGSVEHLMRDLFTPRTRAFYRFGGFFVLPPIDPEAWAEGLTARFAADRCDLHPEALDELVSLGEGHPRATMLVAQQTHAACVAAGTRTVDLGRVRQGLSLAVAAESASLDGDVERIRALGKNALALARLVARGERPYAASAATPAAVSRTLDALRDAGFVEHRGRGDWCVLDPLLRRRLAGRN